MTDRWARGKKKQPEKVGHLAGRLIAKWKGQTQKQHILYQTLWRQIVGERVAHHTRIDHIRRGKLVVLAESSVWMNELTFLKEKIKIEAKNFLSANGISIDDVVFKLGYNHTGRE
ncbi:DUF721 domain-containing protein [candidate division FCPU426 bacterium]|nr:DUF721 domain-containing protein [candidate division FCPU426 bacterium]